MAGGVLIAVAGCVAQAEGAEIVRRAPAVDLVVGSQNYHRLPELLGRAARGDKVVDTQFPVEDKFEALAPPSAAATRARGVAAFVTVQEGCDKFCTFCVVPYTRGAEISRPVEQNYRRSRAAGRRGRSRSHPDRAERQRLSRRRGRTGRGRWRGLSHGWRKSTVSNGCATPRAIPSTWPMTSSPPTATCRS